MTRCIFAAPVRPPPHISLERIQNASPPSASRLTFSSGPGPKTRKPSSSRNPDTSSASNLRCGLFSALLCLAVLLGLAAPAAAQTIDSTEITEGETKTFTITVPSTWPANFQVDNPNYAGDPARVLSCSIVNSGNEWDACYNPGPQNTPTFTIEVRTNADSIDDPDETFKITLWGGSNAFEHSFTITIREKPPLPVGPEHMPQIVLSQDYFKLDEPQANNCSDDKVGTEKTFTTVGNETTVTRNYGPVLTTETYKVSLDRSPGEDKYVSVEIWCAKRTGKR